MYLLTFQAISRKNFTKAEFFQPIFYFFFSCTWSGPATPDKECELLMSENSVQECRNNHEIQTKGAVGYQVIPAFASV